MGVGQGRERQSRIGRCSCLAGRERGADGRPALPAPAAGGRDGGQLAKGRAGEAADFDKAMMQQGGCSRAWREPADSTG